MDHSKHLGGDLEHGVQWNSLNAGVSTAHADGGTTRPGADRSGIANTKSAVITTGADLDGGVRLRSG